MIDPISLAVGVRGMRIPGAAILLERRLVLRVCIRVVGSWSCSVTTSRSVQSVLASSLGLLVVVHLLLQVVVGHLRDLLSGGLRELSLQLMSDLNYRGYMAR